MTRRPHQKTSTPPVSRQARASGTSPASPSSRPAHRRPKPLLRRKSTPRPDRLTGKVLLGRYRIERTLAGGSMGRVYLATQLPFERKVAVKVLYCTEDDDEANQRLRKRFQREASVASQLSHPNIVTVIDYGETEDGDVFMTMEFLEGRPLQALIQEGPLDFARTLAISLQIARALRRAHKFKVVHRDLKPANVMVRSEADGNVLVKVLDFGIVKALSSEDSEISDVADENITSVGSLMGTPGYMAPEQAVGDAIDTRADLYSLGVMMFQMLTGRMPFQGDTVVELVTAQVMNPVPSLKAVDPGVDCPDALDQIIQTCLNKSPTERFESIDELMVHLKDLWRIETEQSYGTEASMLTYLPMQESAIERTVTPMNNIAGARMATLPPGKLEPAALTSAVRGPPPLSKEQGPPGRNLLVMAFGALGLVIFVAVWVFQRSWSPESGAASRAKIVPLSQEEVRTTNLPRGSGVKEGAKPTLVETANPAAPPEASDGYKDNPY